MDAPGSRSGGLRQISGEASSRGFFDDVASRPTAVCVAVAAAGDGVTTLMFERLTIGLGSEARLPAER